MEGNSYGTGLKLTREEIFIGIDVFNREDIKVYIERGGEN